MMTSSAAAPTTTTPNRPAPAPAQHSPSTSPVAADDVVSATPAAAESPPTSPYDLTVRGPGDYLGDVAELADEVLKEGLPRTRELRALHQQHRKEHGRQRRSSRESLVELLSLGVLWRAYGPRVNRLPRAVRWGLTLLAWLRPFTRRLRRPLDGLRGRLLTRWATATTPHAGTSFLTRSTLRGLVGWLAATGDYAAEVRFARSWLRLLGAMDEAQSRVHLAELVDLSLWFEARACRHLAPYTDQSREYRVAQAKRARDREDILFTGRPTVEHHLNLVGAEILNRAFARSYHQSRRRLVLLPGCMRPGSGRGCRAHVNGVGLECVACQAGCAVRQIAALGQRDGFDTRVLTHASQLGVGRTLAARAHEGLGVVGVACSGHLLSGGWLTRDLEVPAQCVVLNRCGCEHWSEQAVPTRLDLSELQRRVMA